MKNEQELSISDIVSDLDSNMHINYQGIYLTNKQVEILKCNGFDYLDFNNIKELIFALDEYLNNDPDNLELENILEDLSEFDYYHNVNK